MPKTIICPTITRHNRKQINRARPPDQKPRPVFTDDTTFSCDICWRRSACHSLCPPMAWLVSRVEVEPSKETPIIDPASIVDHLKTMPWASNLSTNQNVAIMFFFEEFKQKEIAEKLKVSRQYVSRVVKDYRDKIIPKHQKLVDCRL